MHHTFQKIRDHKFLYYSRRLCGKEKLLPSDLPQSLKYVNNFVQKHYLVKKNPNIEALKGHSPVSLIIDLCLKVINIT